MTIYKIIFFYAFRAKFENYKPKSDQIFIGIFIQIAYCIPLISLSLAAPVFFGPVLIEEL